MDGRDAFDSVPQSFPSKYGDAVESVPTTSHSAPGTAHFRGFYLDRDHLPGDEDSDRQEDQTDETPKLTFAPFAAAQSHFSSRQAKKYRAKLLNRPEKPIEVQSGGVEGLANHR